MDSISSVPFHHLFFFFHSLPVVYQFGMCREWVDVEPQSHIDGGIMSGRPSLRGDLGGLPESMMMVGTGKSLSSVNGSRNGISAGRCKSCERKQSCSSCLVDLGCGWCYYSNNPMIGVCKTGDFHSPAAGKMTIQFCVLSFSSNLKLNRQLFRPAGRHAVTAVVIRRRIPRSESAHLELGLRTVP